MATVQMVPQQSQPPIGPGSYSIDSPPASRRQYQQSPPANEQSRSPSNARGSPHSSRRPSRRPSGGNPNLESYPSPQTTPRVPDMPAPHSSATDPHPTNSPSYEPTRNRVDQRQQNQQQGSIPFNPPPRTSSQQRHPGAPLPSDAQLVDRTTTKSDSRRHDDRPSSSRRANADTQPARQSPSAGYSGDTASLAANAAQSRRRGPASTSGPQRATSTREPGTAHPPSAARDRSTINVVSPTSGQRSEGQIINRVVVDDPVVDLRREKERQLESVPGLDTSKTSSPGNIPAPTHKSRQDFSSQNAHAARRKDTRFGEYILGQTLGEGEFGKVKLGWKTDGSVQVAIKLIRRESLGTNPSRLPKINREIKILETLHHPNIVKLHEIIDTNQYIGMVLEYASGGELFDYILNHRYLKDNTARKLFAQLVSGVGYLHKKGIVHRDLKLENLLLDRNKNIIITDFGFANTFDPRDLLDEETEYRLSDKEFVRRMDLDKLRNGTRRGDLMATSCGSPCYAAPELVVTDSLYTGRKVDVWSCGVILYAMLAGYLPFDDDPENPDGDNINQLYKYITTTPLTFPEYVTPHARDLLRRILVADPRKRADLFEVARHSWLSDYAHVVAQVTSSTTSVVEIANTTVDADAKVAPGLVRSHSVREPTKTAPTTMSPVGSLSHQSKMEPVQASERTEHPRDSKRRTVQVEYVAPSRQTARGDSMPRADDTGIPSTPPGSKPRARAGTDIPESTSRTQPSTTKPLPVDPRYRSEKAYHTQSKRGSQPPTSAPQDMAPPSRPQKDFLRSVSDSTSAFTQPATSYARPTTGGSMTSTGATRLPSQGNSYSQPLAPTVAATNAQGRVTAPKSDNRYNISAPMPTNDPYGNQSNSRPSTQHYAAPPSLPSQPQRSHKRANTLGNFFRTGSIYVPKSQTQSPSETPQKTRKHEAPPTSMKYSLPADNEPRTSTDSRRPSFNFSRRSRENTSESRQEKPRRFSLLPASFSFKSFTSTGSGKDGASDFRPASERKQLDLQGKASSRPQTMAYQKRPDEAFDFGEEGDGQRDPRRNTQAAPARKNDYSRRGSTAAPQQYSSRYQSQPNDYPSTKAPPPIERPYLGSASGSQASLPTRQNFQPVYPPGFGSEDQEPQSRPPTQGNRAQRGPAVLTKDRRRFADAYEQNQEPGASAASHHAGSSGAAKRVMDFFRRRGKARADDRM